MPQQHVRNLCPYPIKRKADKSMAHETVYSKWHERKCPKIEHQEFRGTKAQRGGVLWSYIPCHSNMHLLSTKLHAHYPVPKPATIMNALVDAFRRPCKILMLPYTYYVPHIYQESKQHCFVLVHNPVLPSWNTGATLCPHHPSSRLLEPTWTRNSMVHVQRPTCTMQWPTEELESSVKPRSLHSDPRRQHNKQCTKPYKNRNNSTDLAQDPQKKLGSTC